MKKIFGVTIISILFSTLSFANVTITGPSAKKLYDLIPTAAVKQVFLRPMNLKVIGQGFGCSEKINVSDGDGQESYEYFCLLPNKSDDGKIHLLGDLAQPLFEALTNKKAQETVRTSMNCATYVRTLGAISCHERSFLGGKVEFRCMITP